MLQRTTNTTTNTTTTSAFDTHSAPQSRSAAATHSLNCPATHFISDHRARPRRPPSTPAKTQQVVRTAHSQTLLPTQKAQRTSAREYMIQVAALARAAFLAYLAASLPHRGGMSFEDPLSCSFLMLPSARGRSGHTPSAVMSCIKEKCLRFLVDLSRRVHTRWGAGRWHTCSMFERTTTTWSGTPLHPVKLNRLP